MQDTQHLRPTGFVDRLFSVSTIDEYIKLLEKEEMIEYLSCKDFCERIRNLIEGEKVDEFITLLKEQTIAQKKAHPNENYHFPFLRQEEKFMKVAIDTFIVEYMHDRIQDTKNELSDQDWDDNQENGKGNNWTERQSCGTPSDEINNVKESNRSKSRTFRGDQNAKQFEQNMSINEYSSSSIFKFDFECEVIDQSRFYQDMKSKKDYDQKDLKKKEKQIQQLIIPKQNNKEKLQQKTEQLLKLDPYFKDKAVIPKFLTQRQQAFSMLLQVNLTPYFQQILNQIKSMIKSQIQKNIVLRYYQKFFSQYLQFKLISQGKCEQKININDERINQILKEMKQYWSQGNRTIKYLPGKRQSYHLKVWQCIYQQLNRQKKGHRFKQDIKKTGGYLLKGVEKIYLSFKFKFNTSMIYGLTKSRNIFINLNVKQKNLTLQQFVQGPLRPYIALTIYHELAHFLIRSYNFDRDRDSGQSFKVCNSTIGHKILQSFQKQYSGIPQYLKISSDLWANYHKSNSNIKNHASILFNFLQNYSLTIKIIQDFYQKKKVQKLVQKVQIIKQVLGQSLESLDIINISFQQYKDLTSYIDDLSKNNEQIIIDAQKQLKYSVFFSLFLIPWIHDAFFKPEQMDKVNYQQSCHKILNSKIKRYFLRQNHVIQQFSKDYFNYLKEQSNNNSTQIKKTIQFEQQYRKFVNLMLKKQVNQVNDINRQIDQLSSKIPKGLLKDFNKELTQLLQNKLSKFMQIFPFFKLRLYSTLHENSLLQQFISEFPLFKQIVDAYQSYYMLMNFLKYYQFLIVSSQIPSFYTHDLFESQKEKRSNTKRKSNHRKLEAGFDMERRLFPTLVHTQTIYKKDYGHMKTLNTKTSKLNIGKVPSIQKQRRLKINVAKDGNCIERGMFLNTRTCGTRRYTQLNKAWESRKNKERKQRQ